MEKQPHILFFGHIPKTAGSTFKTILWRQYGADRVFFSMEPSGHVHRFDELAVRLLAGERPPAVIVTHAGYGAQERLPDTFSYPAITFLREPIDRVVSGYYMFQRQGRIPKDMPLDRFVRTYLKPGCNMQTSFLSGYFWECHRDGREPEREAFNEQMLARARANLANHVVVGLTERFDDSLMLLRQAFGWDRRRMLYYRTNVGHNRAPTTRIPADVLRVVEEYNALDLALYDEARRLFEAQWVRHAEALERELHAYRRLNRLYQHVAPRVVPLARQVVNGLKRIRFHGA